MRLKYTAAWVGFTAAAMLAASACGAEGARTATKAVDNAGKAMAALTRAADRTENLGSAEVKMSTDLGTGTGPITMEGTYSWGNGLEFDVKMDAKAAQMQTLTSSPKVRMLFVGGAYYYDIDPQLSGPLKGKEWMKIDTSAVLPANAERSTSHCCQPAEFPVAAFHAPVVPVGLHVPSALSVW